MFGTGDVDFDRGDPRLLVQNPRHHCVVFDRLGRDIYDRRHLPVCPDRRVLLDEAVDAGILQADRVQHAGGGFGNSRHRVTRPRLRRDAFAHEGAQALHVDDARIFEPIAETAGCGDDRIGEA
jgi:hypothetical protein